MNKRTVPNHFIVLKALSNGAEIEIDGLTYTFVDGRLCLRLSVYKSPTAVLSDKPDEIRWAESDMTLNDFIQYCEEMDEGEILSLGFSNVMASACAAKYSTK